MADNHKPLRKISEAFKELEATVNSQTPDDVKVASFSRACTLISPLFGCLGIAFKFAEMDYVAKVNDLVEASKSIGTLQDMIERDVEANTVKKGGSHTRNLLRVKRGIDMIKVLFEQMLVTGWGHVGVPPACPEWTRGGLDYVVARQYNQIGEIVSPKI
ncbi:hypothetical protein CMV_015657 [Castanea mollissima]|uniref:Glycolipid transfer protein domain-containing protein n=1 Tax=Castanea mollissima TaxID=60419 RepID=A0A8J4R9Y7_9ROSI|nr:hypothetical protein CMV_015657 [Castanea mollissima]